MMPEAPPAPDATAALDACPGLLVLHPARDGHLARIRLPGGYASGRRWRALARMARDFGDGNVDITARGNVQLRGLRPADARALARQGERAGLLPSAAHDRARNIMASPLAGLAGRPGLRRLVRELDAVLLADPGLAALPGRFLFSADDGTGGSGLAGCDVGLRRSGGDYELVIAGRDAGVRVRAGAGATAAAAARAAIAQGVGRDVTRIAGLADGGAAVAATVGGSLGAPAASLDGRLSLGPLTPAPGCSADSFSTMVVGARLGRLSWSQMTLIVGLLRTGDVIRLGIAGRLVIPLAPSADAAAVSARLAAAGLLVAADDPLAGVTACAGVACSRSLGDVRSAARPLPGHPRTHWSGCERHCGLPPDAEPVALFPASRTGPTHLPFLLHTPPSLVAPRSSVQAASRPSGRSLPLAGAR